MPSSPRWPVPPRAKGSLCPGPSVDPVDPHPERRTLSRLTLDRIQASNDLFHVLAVLAIVNQGGLQSGPAGNRNAGTALDGSHSCIDRLSPRFETHPRARFDRRFVNAPNHLHPRKRLKCRQQLLHGLHRVGWHEKFSTELAHHSALHARHSRQVRRPRIPDTTLRDCLLSELLATSAEEDHTQPGHGRPRHHQPAQQSLDRGDGSAAAVTLDGILRCVWRHMIADWPRNLLRKLPFDGIPPAPDRTSDTANNRRP